ncbi:MAG: hypothetical protein HYY26_02965 [Acidobacteria bacterium]|nr:hypothetical protein [Acidobacteriota bacterium]
MEKKSTAQEIAPPERRRFLRESLRGSVPLLVSWLGARAVRLGRLLRPGASPPRTSPPPETEPAPVEARQQLEKHYEDFSRDNPEPPDPQSA